MRPDRGVFTISLDFELIWGTLDKPKWRRFQRLCAIEREEVVDRLLELFAEFDVSATWCVVGHLFQDHCRPGCPHPALPGAAGTGDERSAPLFYGRTLVRKILECRARQEIGSHTFSHVLMEEARCQVETAEREVAESVRAARSLGVSMSSFAFPRNRAGHLDVLRRHGFTTYRGTGLSWYEKDGHSRLARRAGHLWDILTASEPPVTDPVKTASGLYNVAGSMLYTPSFGLRRLLPVSLRVKRARKGLDRAVSSKRVFHLWMHPTDLVVRKEAMLAGLREILSTAARMRAAGQLDILPMRDVAGAGSQRGASAVGRGAAVAV